jgi:hypothetical protein
MLPATVGNVIVVIIIIIINDDGVDVAVVVGLVFPKPCPSLCQVSMGWWTEDQPYSVSCWTQSHWHSLVTHFLIFPDPMQDITRGVDPGYCILSLAGNI